MQSLLGTEIKPRTLILVACEESGIVTRKFRERGHMAYSCDVMPTRGNTAWHIQGDVKGVVNEREWRIVLAFPPCTHICVSGARYFPEKIADGRQQQGIDFFMQFVRWWEADKSRKLCIENPVGIMSSVYREPDQIIQPYMFGENASKATCLWLFGLPPLKGTKQIAPDKNGRYANQSPSGSNRLGPSPTRSRDRSVTYNGIAQAMVEQWG